MSDPVTATIQTIQLGISAVKAGAAIAGLWEARRGRRDTASSQEESKPKSGPGIDEILLVLSTLGQRLLLLDVINFDVLPDAYKAVRAAMRAVDSDDDDVGYEVDKLGPVLQHLVAAAMMFCAACHPMPIYQGFGCGVLDCAGWAHPGRWNLWMIEIDRAISLLKSIPQDFQLFKKSPSRIGREEPFYEEIDKKNQKMIDGINKDLTKELEKKGIPPLLNDSGVQIRSWWFSGATYGDDSIYSNYGHSYGVLSQYQFDTGRFLYAWTIGEHADLRPWEAIMLTQNHITELAEWLEGLNGITFKIIRDNEMDWSKIKLKSSTKKFFKARSGAEIGCSNDPMMLIRNPDPTAILIKRMDELHFVSVADVNVTKTTIVEADSPIVVKEKEKPSAVVGSLNSSSPPMTPTREIPSPTRMSSVVPIIRKPVSTAQSTSTATDTVKLPNSPSTVPSEDVSSASTTPEETVPILSRSTSEATTPPSTAPTTPTNTQPISSPASPSKLPPGWEERCMPNGQVYFIDHTTKTTTWTRPEPPSLSSPPPPPPNYDISMAGSPLPPGWETRIDSRKQMYYVDHNTRTTSWIRPSIESG